MTGGRVLMLCYFFPPLQSAGVARSVGFASRLAQFGWTPTVLTVDQAHDDWDLLGHDFPVPAGVAVERAPEFNLIRPVNLLDTLVNKGLGLLGYRRLHFLFRDSLCSPDPQIAWRAVAAGRRLAAGHDCIYVSCSPFSSALKGVALKRVTGLPLVVDFRDPWRFNSYARRRSALGRWRLRRWERRVVNQADRLILNTPGTLKLYRRAYPQRAHAFRCVPNGYDRFNLPADPRPRQDRFTIMHVGSLYGSRDPGRLMSVLAELNLPELRFVQVGQGSPALEAYADRLRIHVTGPVTPDQALAHMRQASLLYLTQAWNPGVTDYPSVAMKTYEYLATGWPILVECPPGDNVEMVRRYGNHPELVDRQDRSALRAAVLRAHGRWRSTPARVDDGFRHRFNRYALTARLAGVLAEVSTRRSTDARGAVTGTPGEQAAAESLRAMDARSAEQGSAGAGHRSEPDCGPGRSARMRRPTGRGMQ